MKKVISLFLSAMMILTSVLCVNFQHLRKILKAAQLNWAKTQ